MTLKAVTGEKQFGLLTHAITMCCQGMIPGHVLQTRRSVHFKTLTRLYENSSLELIRHFLSEISIQKVKMSLEKMTEYT